MKTYNLYITPLGELQFIFYDKLHSLLIGDAAIKRVSHINPTTQDNKVEWWVDLTPLGKSIILGPFKTRERAIEEEIKWIEDHYERI